MNIDPLAEKYVYNSPYNFAENRVIDGRELEGLEWVDADDHTKLIYDPAADNGKVIILSMQLKWTEIMVQV